MFRTQHRMLRVWFKTFLRKCLSPLKNLKVSIGTSCYFSLKTNSTRMVVIECDWIALNSLMTKIIKENKKIGLKERLIKKRSSFSVLYVRNSLKIALRHSFWYLCIPLGYRSAFWFTKRRLSLAILIRFFLFYEIFPKFLWFKKFKLKKFMCGTRLN